jgi:phosphoglycolate phosphatase-like HAD superfamily hydrolase
MSEGSKPVVCVDLDGVLNDFDGWKAPEYYHPPRAGSREFLEELNALGYEVVIFTTRWAPHVEEWLLKHGLAGLVSRVTDKKPAAHVFVDDRAICFRGDYASTLEQIARFRAHWEPDREVKAE